MPKSKRSKIITLARTEKHVVKRKNKLIDNIKESIEQFPYIYVFETENLRTQHLKDVRHFWEGSRFFLGKNKVMQIALGRTPSEEIKDGLCELGKHVVGNCGLFFTTSPPEDVVPYFKAFSTEDYARSGFSATQTVTLPAGPLTNFAHSLEPWLRKLGMPTKLQKGVIVLEREHVVCKEGDMLTPEQAKVLKLMDVRMSSFHINMKYMWHDGEVKELDN